VKQYEISSLLKENCIWAILLEPSSGLASGGKPIGEAISMAILDRPRSSSCAAGRMICTFVHISAATSLSSCRQPLSIQAAYEHRP